METSAADNRFASAMAMTAMALALWALLFVAVQSTSAQLARWVEHPAIGASATAIFLALAVSLAFRFPIHVRAKTKVYTNSVPLFLLAALLPPVAAGIVAGFGQGVGELMSRSRTRTPWHSTIGQSARWVLISLMGSLLAHARMGPGHPQILPLLVAAGAMLAGDILTAPVVLGPLTHEKPFRIVISVAREAGLPEGAQYLIGILGAVVARQQLGLLVLLALPTVLVYQAFKRAKDMQIGTQQLLESMADTVDLRDPYTGGHSRRVTEFSRAILRQLGIRGPEMDLIVSAARVHDIGKLGVPDHVLNKTGKLTAEEWAIMATHPDQGAELLTRYPDFARGVGIVRHHHERWDGTGYPHRLRALEIPFGARVIAVADSFDAMTSDRPYRPGMTAERALEILLDGRGQQWDGQVVDAMVRAVTSGQVVAAETRDKYTSKPEPTGPQLAAQMLPAHPPFAAGDA